MKVTGLLIENPKSYVWGHVLNLKTLTKITPTLTLSFLISLFFSVS